MTSAMSIYMRDDVLLVQGKWHNIARLSKDDTIGIVLGQPWRKLPR